MQFAADHRETLEVFHAANRWHKRPSLRFSVRNAISAIPADMLHRTWQQLEYCLDVLRSTKVDHIEVYWNQ
jgi:hypothetical protein